MFHLPPPSTNGPREGLQKSKPKEKSKTKDKPKEPAASMAPTKSSRTERESRVKSAFNSTSKVLYVADSVGHTTSANSWKNLRGPESELPELTVLSLIKGPDGQHRCC